MMTELYGGARIAYIFNSIFCKKVQVWPPPRALVCAPNAAAHCLRTFTSLQCRPMRYVRQELSPFDGLTDLEIATAIRNSTGTRIPLFVPEGSFDLLVRRQIKKLEYLVRAGRRTHGACGSNGGLVAPRPTPHPSPCGGGSGVGVLRG